MIVKKRSRYGAYSTTLQQKWHETGIQVSNFMPFTLSFLYRETVLPSFTEYRQLSVTLQPVYFSSAKR